MEMAFHNSKVWAATISSIPPLFIEVSAPSQESEEIFEIRIIELKSDEFHIGK
jgi:hypothetical protein